MGYARSKVTIRSSALGHGDPTTALSWEAAVVLLQWPGDPVHQVATVESSQPVEKTGERTGRVACESWDRICCQGLRDPRDVD